ncbi:Uncharacterised protein [Mycobacteroides abscessus subsp. massiliense]|nr:Uncharacterised protein [Mycobacteroides abscessus subsp. massiliense]
MYRVLTTHHAVKGVAAFFGITGDAVEVAAACRFACPRALLRRAPALQLLLHLAFFRLQGGDKTFKFFFLCGAVGDGVFQNRQPRFDVHLFGDTRLGKIVAPSGYGSLQVGIDGFVAVALVRHFLGGKVFLRQHFAQLSTHFIYCVLDFADAFVHYRFRREVFRRINQGMKTAAYQTAYSAG